MRAHCGADGTASAGGLRLPHAILRVRLHRFAADGSDRGTALIRARDDAEARDRADSLAEGLLAELWSGDRLLDHLAPAGHPVADRIRPTRDGPRARGRAGLPAMRARSCYIIACPRERCDTPRMSVEATLCDLVTAERIAIEDVGAAIDAYLAEPTTQDHSIGPDHVLDLAAAVAAHPSAPAIVVDAEANEPSRRMAVRAALLMSRPTTRSNSDEDRTDDQLSTQ